MRVLVIDDAPEVRSTIAEMLDFEGHEVATAADGAEALSALDRFRPGVVLLDMRMPTLDGWGFARGLGERRMDIRLVVMTAARDAERWATEVGADGYLAKPFGFEELLAAVGSPS